VKLKAPEQSKAVGGIPETALLVCFHDGVAEIRNPLSQVMS
jgi:hypothetical protein